MASRLIVPRVLSFEILTVVVADESIQYRLMLFGGVSDQFLEFAIVSILYHARNIVFYTSLVCELEKRYYLLDRNVPLSEPAGELGGWSVAALLVSSAVGISILLVPVWRQFRNRPEFS